MPQTSYQEQYARVVNSDDSQPLLPVYNDILQEIIELDANAAKDGVLRRLVYDPNEAMR